MSVQLHQLLATASIALMLAVGLEAALRAWRGSPPGAWAGRLQVLLLIVLGATGAGGAGLLVGGARPAEWLHLVYAVLAFGTIPLANSLGAGREPRTRAIATLSGSLVGIVLIARLTATG